MPIKYETNNHVAVITIDRPPVNAFTLALYRELHATLLRFVQDADVHVGVLTGAGTRAFSAGHDIKEKKLARSSEDQALRHLLPGNDPQDSEEPNWEFEVMRLQRFKPIIGAVNGPAIGQGLLFLLSLTDLRIAGRSARFALPEIQYGMGGGGGMVKLGSQIPHSAALWLCLTGEAIDADAAYRCNLVNEVVDDSQVMLRAMQLANRIASLPPAAVRVEMEAYYRGRDLTHEQSLTLSQHLFRLQLLSRNQKEAIQIAKP